MTAEPDDTGGADSALQAALAAWAADPGPATCAQVYAALLPARLLIPLVPVSADPTGGGRRRELAAATLIGRDGAPAVPAFTSVDALARWRPDARPVTVTARDALASALREDAAAVVLDVAGPVAFAVEEPALRDLAGGFVPVGGAEEIATSTVAGGLSAIQPVCDVGAELVEAVRAALAREPAVAEAYLLAPEVTPDSSDVALGLVLFAELAPTELVELGRRLSALASAPSVARGLDVAVLTAEQRGQARALTAPVYTASR